MRKKLTYFIVLFLVGIQIHASNNNDTCLSPTNLQIINLTTYSIGFEWEDANPDGSTLFQYTIVEEGLPLGGPTTTQTEGSSVAYMLLNASTTYSLYVRAMCMGTWSDWSDALTFTTASCDAVDMPYIQDFENLTSFFNLVECTTWEVLSGNYWTTNQSPVTGLTGNTLSYSANETEDANSWYIFQNGINIEEGDKIKVSFQYKSEGVGTEELLNVYMATSINDLIDGNGLTIGNITITNNNVTEYSTGPIPFMATGVYYFGFQAASDANQGTIYIDDFRVEEWVCGTPDEIEVNDISIEGASLSWSTTGSNMTHFHQYSVSTDDTEPQDGASTIMSTGTNLNNVIEGLQPNTIYYVYVRSSCSGVFSDWSGPVSFMTLCDSTIALPTGETEQILTEGETLADLDVEGENLTWYSDEDLTTEIEATTVAVDGTIYYVTQTIVNCTSEALAVTVTVIDPCAEITLPIGATEQVLTEGETLADLDVDGENLTWYSDQDLTTEVEATTIAINGTTYYVTQTIGGCTSDALAITVEVTLSIDGIDVANTIGYFPNPVKDFLNISSEFNMTHIEVINIVGQTVISYNINASEARVNMTELPNGNYFVKINANGAVKVIKVLK